MIYISLGTNLEPRRQHLQRAKTEIAALGYKIFAKSLIYETPALLPLHATNDWQKNFLNQTIAIEYAKSPETLLQDLKNIETKMGRDHSLKWGPRPIDLDILLYHNEAINTEILCIPHKDLKHRNFFFASPDRRN